MPGGEPQGPIFVVGSMRSGSTMLRLILDSHPHIAVGPETGFMRAVRAAKQIPGWRMGERWYERLNWSEHEIDARLREYYDGLFRRYAAGQGKRRWGEKTPFHTEHITEMAQIFPDAVFVAIVRHPGAVAASLRKNFHYAFGDALRYWSATNLALVRQGAALDGRFALCRYEDLVCAGEPVLRELLEFLGEPWDPRVLEHDKVQREKGAPRAVEGSTVAHDPIDARRATGWSRSLGAADLAALDELRDLAGFFGYRPRSPEPGPVPADGGWLLTGSDHAARRDDAAPPDGDPRELAERLQHVERVLARVRSRRAVRLADALRKAQHARSRAAFVDAWRVLRGTSSPTGRQR